MFHTSQLAGHFPIFFFLGGVLRSFARLWLPLAPADLPGASRGGQATTLDPRDGDRQFRRVCLGAASVNSDESGNPRSRVRATTGDDGGYQFLSVFSLLHFRELTHSRCWRRVSRNTSRTGLQLLVNTPGGR